MFEEYKMQSDIEEYIEAYNKRLIEHYADYSMDRLKDELVAAQDKHAKAVMNYQRHYLRSDKVFIEDAAVRIENLKFVIKHRSGEQS
jgi:hypothetical protein